MSATLMVPVSANTPVSVGDLLRFSRFGDPQSIDWYGDARAGEPVIWSPDRSHLAVVVRSGDPETETNVSRIFVFSREDLKRATPPVEVVNFGATAAYQPISFVRWLNDSKTLVFAASRGDAIPQIFKVDIYTRKLSKMTDLQVPLKGYGISASGHTLLTVTESIQLTRLADDTECRRLGCHITAANLWAAAYQKERRTSLVEVTDVLGGRTTSLINPVANDPTLRDCDLELKANISPDGRFALSSCIISGEKAPEIWKEYNQGPYAKMCAETQDVDCWRIIYLIDLATGKATRLSEAPQSPWLFSPVWVDGGRKLIIPAGFESLTQGGKFERQQRRERLSILQVDTSTLEIRRIGFLTVSKAVRLRSAEWDHAGEILSIATEGDSQVEPTMVHFRRKGHQWVSVASASPMRLTVEQSINERPVLYVTEAGLAKKYPLFDPNVWLAERKTGRVEAIEWRTSTGQMRHGGLYFPPDYVAGQRYPLVIQTHGFSPSRFSLNGEARNFPGAALAATGIIVLQADDVDLDAYFTPNVWIASVSVFEGAIDHLDRLGLINPSKVGTIGWSATGPTTSAMFTHSDHAIAAAAFTDTGVFGWWHDMLNGSIGYNVRFGSAGHGPGLKNWLERSPTFNLERMRTPLLIWSAEGIGPWDFYVGLRSQNKPVELWNLPTGTHDVYQASQRLKTNQLLVDWFTFWLKGEERTELVPWGGETEASLADQYARWRVMRKQQEAVLSQPRPPLLKWTATPVKDAVEQAERP